MRHRFEIYQGHTLQFFWRLVAPNGKIIADGGEGYSTKSNAKRAVRKFRLGIVMAQTTLVVK